MILKIDHIAFATAQMDADIAAFESLGYTVRFRERALPNLANKGSLSQKFGSRFDMSFLTSRGCPNIELLDHGHTLGHTAGLSPVLSLATTKQPGQTIEVEGRQFSRARLGPPDAPIYLSVDSPDGASAIVSDTVDLATSEAFWTEFGFVRVTSSAHSARLALRAPFVSPSELYLRTPDDRAFRAPAEHAYLDTRGFNAIALFSTDAEKEHRRCDVLGLSPTSIGTLTIQGKLLQIFWLKGPSRELVEIVGFAGSRNPG